MHNNEQYMYENNQNKKRSSVEWELDAHASFFKNL